MRNIETLRTTIARPVPILRYLALDPRPGDESMCTDAALFGDQLDALLAHGYVPLTIRHLVASITLDAPLPTRSILITFDHGLRGFHQFGLPALKNRDIPSTVFVTTGSVGRESRLFPTARPIERTTMSWTQLKECISEDVVIGSAGHSGRALDVMSRWEASEELALSKSLLEHQLECVIAAAAYPAGLHSQATKDAAGRGGYEAACGLQGSVSSNYDDLFSLSRLPVEGAVRPEVLLARLVIASKTLPKPGESLPVRVQRLVRRVELAASAMWHQPMRSALLGGNRPRRRPERWLPSRGDSSGWLGPLPNPHPNAVDLAYAQACDRHRN